NVLDRDLPDHPVRPGRRPTVDLRARQSGRMQSAGADDPDLRVRYRDLRNPPALAQVDRAGAQPREHTQATLQPYQLPARQDQAGVGSEGAGVDRHYEDGGGAGHAVRDSSKGPRAQAHPEPGSLKQLPQSRGAAVTGKFLAGGVRLKVMPRVALVPVDHQT